MSKVTHASKTISQGLYMQKHTVTVASLLVTGCVLIGCNDASNGAEKQSLQTSPEQKVEFYGTKEPFAKEAIYFIMTDRFVDGDPSNNHETQGGEHPTFNRPLKSASGLEANVGYMGGDLKGVLNNAQFIADMGFTAIWLTPLVDNPDEAFNGGEPIQFGGKFKDGGKTGYHGYWASNFYTIDEHYPSVDLDYKVFTQTLRQTYGIKSVFDIVANHGSPSFTMEKDQPKFAELYDKNGNLVADHENLHPTELDMNNPLHQFFNQQPDIMQLSDLNESNPALQDYLINAYLHWIEQGADAFRIDTIKHVPHHFWKTMSDRIRQKHPGFYMFGESYDFNAEFIAQHTFPENGGISVLDFPGKQAITSVFENDDSDFSELRDYLYLKNGPYHNPYDLTTFYDNHDMARMNASDEGFINAHNWLFTTRGIPVIYQGSEMGFMRGTEEHAGNRNYYGQENINKSKQHKIHAALSRIAAVRKASPALQSGLQLNVELAGNRAVFYRVLDIEGLSQIALVLLNKGNKDESFTVTEYLQPGEWNNALSGEMKSVASSDATLTTTVAANGVEVWLLNDSVTDSQLKEALISLMEEK